LFKQRKNKRFNYKPRFGENASETNSDKIKHNWEELNALSQKKRKAGFSLIWLIIILALVLFLMFYFETKT
jgi:hypothetical protein